MTTKTNTATELTNEQLLALVKARGLDQKKPRNTVKMTDKGGLFISLESYQSISDKTGKPFQFGINIHGYQVEGFINSVLDGTLSKALKSMK